MNSNIGRIFLCVFLLASTACADELADGYFDAAALDWSGDDIDYQQALCITDARLRERYDVELQMTSATWSDHIGFGVTLVCTPWEDMDIPTDWWGHSVIADYNGVQVKWTMGLITYTPGSRPHPSCAPIALWERTEPIGDPWDPGNSGSIDKYIPKGFVWVSIPVTKGSFFHSPATANIAGIDYSDADEMPTFTELPPIPEPAMMLLLITGGLLSLIRRGCGMVKAGRGEVRQGSAGRG